MYAVVVQVDLDTSRQDEGVQTLESFVVPTVKAMPGFVSGTWMRSLDGSEGRSLLVFESREAAEAAAARIAEGPPAGAPVTFRSADVGEVLAQA